MATDITFESHPVSYILSLKQEIKDMKPQSQDYKDEDDLYQARLEYGWWKEEQQDLIDTLTLKLTKNQLLELNKF